MACCSSSTATTAGSLLLPAAGTGAIATAASSAAGAGWVAPSLLLRLASVVLGLLSVVFGFVLGSAWLAALVRAFALASAFSSAMAKPSDFGFAAALASEVLGFASRCALRRATLISL